MRIPNEHRMRAYFEKAGLRLNQREDLPGASGAGNWWVSQPSTDLVLNGASTRLELWVWWAGCALGMLKEEERRKLFLREYRRRDAQGRQEMRAWLKNYSHEGNDGPLTRLFAPLSSMTLDNMPKDWQTRFRKHAAAGAAHFDFLRNLDDSMNSADQQAQRHGE